MQRHAHGALLLACGLGVLAAGAGAPAWAAAPDEHDRPRAEERSSGRPPERPAERPPLGRPSERPGERPPLGRPSERPGERPPLGRPPADGRGQVLDQRYNHGRYYPPAGAMLPALPGGYRPYYRGPDRYYFNGGVWYAPRGPGFVVIRPPPGLVISVLPPYYSTVWIGGVPYYYANNVYYSWQPDQGGYAVVDPPSDADQPSPPPDAAPDSAQDLIIYPKNGQSKDQQAADQYECHNWSKSQTGFDPTQPAGGVSPADAERARNNYNRAMSACLQGRGYQVN